MRRFLFCMLLLFAAGAAKAQYPKWVISFTNKQNNAYSITNPSQFLSAKAIQRRTKYNIIIDSTDLPVTASYIAAVKAQGALTVLSQSKWLNQILIYCTDATVIAKIQALPFVKNTASVGNRTSLGGRFTETFTTTTTLQAGRNAGTQANFYNYGSAEGQVEIHNGSFLHNKGFRGQGMTIAVLDAGFYQYLNHTAFDSARNNNQFLGVKDFVDFDNSVNEDDTHGMSCLSTIAANQPGQMVGTAPKANFYLIRTEKASSEYPTEEFNWVVGAEYADSCGADLITSSLGYTTFDDPAFDHNYNEFYKNQATSSKGAAMAAKKGILVTNSAGNEGGSSWNYLGFPADPDSVCAVGAVNASGAVAGFSSYGYPGKIKPNIASVGWNTYVAGPGNSFGYGNGTSYANPNINGLITCLWQAFPEYNNMKILDAVYKSCPTYTTPDNRIGYGIPNMKTAYRMLKKEQNTTLYGSEWLWATPNPFTTQIDVQLIGQIDGDATIKLLNSNNSVVATLTLTTELEEVYRPTLTALGNLPAGTYTLTYTDANKTRSLILSKTGVTAKDWLIAYPVPFQNQFTVYLTAPETGKASVRLLSMSGQLLETLSLDITQNTAYTLTFSKAASLAAGIYQVQYISNTQKKTVSVVKRNP